MKLVKAKKATDLANEKMQDKKAEEMKITFKTYEFIQVPFVASTDERLSAVDVRVLVCLYGMVASDIAKKAGKDFEYKPFCTCNNTNIESMAHITRKPLLKALDNLVKCGYIKIEEVKNKYGSRRIELQNPSACDVEIELDKDTRKYRTLHEKLVEDENVAEDTEVKVTVYGKKIADSKGDLTVTAFDKEVFEVNGKTQEFKSSIDKNAKHETTRQNMKSGEKKRKLKKAQKDREYNPNEGHGTSISKW